jgi:hypothetical protein
MDLLIELDARSLAGDVVDVSKKFSKRVQTALRARYAAYRRRWDPRNKRD